VLPRARTMIARSEGTLSRAMGRDLESTRRLADAPPVRLLPTRRAL
jgi:hypothetical protein